MRSWPADSIVALGTGVLLLCVLAGTAGLGPLGALAGLACLLACNALLAHGLASAGRSRLRPADRITLARATLVAGVAALVAGSFRGPVSVAALATLAGCALVLDAVDGYVARRDRCTGLGARFDMEVDAFLILVLSGYASHQFGGWVLAIGAARYGYLLAGWLQPWLAEPVPPRHWSKVVAAIQGVVLATAAAGLLPGPVIGAAIVLAMALLAESFGHQNPGAGPAAPGHCRLPPAGRQRGPWLSRPAPDSRLPHAAGGLGRTRSPVGAGCDRSPVGWLPDWPSRRSGSR